MTLPFVPKGCDDGLVSPYQCFAGFTDPDTRFSKIGLADYDCCLFGVGVAGDAMTIGGSVFTPPTWSAGNTCPPGGLTDGHVIWTACNCATAVITESTGSFADPSQFPVGFKAAIRSVAQLIDVVRGGDGGFSVVSNTLAYWQYHDPACGQATGGTDYCFPIVLAN